MHKESAIIKPKTKFSTNYVVYFYLPFCGPTFSDSKEVEADRSESGSSPDSIPNGPLHWAENVI
jgi:hypothetical protein